MDFDISFIRRDLTTRVSPVSLGLSLTLLKMSANVDGGPKKATIRADGNLDALQNLYTLMRGGVEIYGHGSVPLWWGCVWKITIHNGGMQYSWTLDDFANSISIIYLLQTINQQFSGAGTRAETAFATDTNSISEYGTKQLKLRGSNGSATAANSRRTFEIENRKEPQINIQPNDTSSQEPYAVIEVRGWWETIDCHYIYSLIKN